MKLWHFIVVGVFLTVLYFLLPWAFTLAVIIIAIYVIYWVVSKILMWNTPPGKRIKHGLLKAHLENKYGKKEGDGIYKQFVGELKKKGYR